MLENCIWVFFGVQIIKDGREGRREYGKIALNNIVALLENL